MFTVKYLTNRSALTDIFCHYRMVNFIIFRILIRSTPALRTRQYYGHPAIKDTFANPRQNYYKVHCNSSRYYTESCYYVTCMHADTYGPQQIFSVLYSCYNGHLAVFFSKCNMMVDYIWFVNCYRFWIYWRKYLSHKTKTEHKVCCTF